MKQFCESLYIVECPCHIIGPNMWPNITTLHHLLGLSENWQKGSNDIPSKNGLFLCYYSVFWHKSGTNRKQRSRAIQLCGYEDTTCLPSLVFPHTSQKLQTSEPVWSSLYLQPLWPFFYFADDLLYFLTHYLIHTLVGLHCWAREVMGLWYHTEGDIQSSLCTATWAWPEQPGGNSGLLEILCVLHSSHPHILMSNFLSLDDNDGTYALMVANSVTKHVPGVAAQVVRNMITFLSPFLSHK